MHHDLHLYCPECGAPRPHHSLCGQGHYNFDTSTRCRYPACNQPIARTAKCPNHYGVVERLGEHGTGALTQICRCCITRQNKSDPDSCPLCCMSPYYAMATTADGGLTDFQAPATEPQLRTEAYTARFTTATIAGKPPPLAIRQEEARLRQARLDSSTIVGPAAVPKHATPPPVPPKATAPVAYTVPTITPQGAQPAPDNVTPPLIKKGPPELRRLPLDATQAAPPPYNSASLVPSTSLAQTGETTQFELQMDTTSTVVATAGIQQEASAPNTENIMVQGPIIEQPAILERPRPEAGNAPLPPASSGSDPWQRRPEASTPAPAKARAPELHTPLRHRGRWHASEQDTLANTPLPTMETLTAMQEMARAPSDPGQSQHLKGHSHHQYSTSFTESLWLKHSNFDELVSHYTKLHLGDQQASILDVPPPFQMMGTQTHTATYPR